MPDLRIQTAKDNGDLPTDHGQDYRFITVEEVRAELNIKSIKDSKILKLYYEQFKKEFNRPSVFENSRSQDS